jgi:hypothetical protein
VIAGPASPYGAPAVRTWCAALSQFGQHVCEQRLQIGLRLARELGHPAQFVGTRPRDLRGSTSLFGSSAHLFRRSPQIFSLLSLAFFEESLLFVAGSLRLPPDSALFGQLALFFRMPPRLLSTEPRFFSQLPGVLGVTLGSFVDVRWPVSRLVVTRHQVLGAGYVMPRLGDGQSRIAPVVARKADFARVRKIGLTIQGLEEEKAWNGPCLKAHKKIAACMATHTSAEPGTLVVVVGEDVRDELIEGDPDVYYVKEHYIPWPTVLVRLNLIDDLMLRDLLLMAVRYRSAQSKKSARTRKR